MRYRLLVSLLALPLLAVAARADEVRGRVVGVDLDRKEMALAGVGRNRGLEYHFKLDDRTRVLFAGRPGRLDDLGGARRARVEFEERDGQSIARVIRVPGLPPSARRADLPAAPAPDGDQLIGTLRRVSQAEREIVVIGPGAKGAETETTVEVPKAASIHKDGKKVGLESLKEGDPVTVQIDRKGDQKVARSIQVGPSGEAAAQSPARQDAIPRVRRLLKLLDQILGQMEQRPGK
jgi:hypothetical protein